MSDRVDRITAGDLGRRITVSGHLRLTNNGYGATGAEAVSVKGELLRVVYLQDSDYYRLLIGPAESPVEVYVKGDRLAMLGIA